MRIVHVLGALVAGGAERVVSELLPPMRRAGHDVRLLLLSSRHDRAGDEMARQLRAAGVAVSAGPTVRVRAASVVWLARSLRSIRPEVVHLHNLNAEMAYLLARPALAFPHRLVRTVHNTTLDAPLLARLGFRWNPVAATVFCGASSETENQARFRGATEVILNGVLFDWEPRDERVRASARRKLGWDAETRDFLCAGRMDGPDPALAQKAHDALIRAWTKSGLGARGGRLHLLGDGNLRPALEKLAAGEPSIHFPGVRSDARLWMQAADVFVMPSRWEGLPMAALEAVGTGLPCVFSRIPSLVELSAPSISWCEPGDVGSLAEALNRALELEPPAARDVRAFRERFGIEAAARRHLALYARLEAGARGPGSDASADGRVS